MPVTERSIILSVPMDLVARYLQDPKNYPAICKNILDVSDIRHLDRHITRFNWTYKLCDVRFEGEASFSNDGALHKLDIQFQGGIHGGWLWNLEPVEDGVRVKLTIEYTIPVILRNQKELRACTESEKGIEQLLESLKTVFVRTEVNDS
jgi:hypothetical protein